MARIEFLKMKKITLDKYVERYGTREASERLGMSLVTVWRWIKEERDVTIEFQNNQPVALTTRTPLPNAMIITR